MAVKGSGEKSKREPCSVCGRLVVRRVDAQCAAKCRSCRKADPSPATFNDFRSHLHKHGLTVDRYQEMLAVQDSRCGVCQKEMENPCIDHDHTCCPGRYGCEKCIRGLLCSGCNIILERAWMHRDAIQRWARRSMRRVACFDLDSTVCSTVHRRHLLPAIRAGESTWLDYAMMCGDDQPIHGTVAVMRELQPDHLIFAVSGRSIEAEEMTWAWMRRYAVPVDRMFLRTDGRPTAEWKISVIRQLQGQGYEVSLFFEDWAEAAAEIAEATGIPVLVVNPCDPAELGERQGAI